MATNSVIDKEPASSTTLSCSLVLDGWYLQYSINELGAKTEIQTASVFQASVLFS